jgi:formiminotetrahydrofolate cyclodeaminase
MLIKKQVDDFIEELASDSPAPGGGSVAALSGAMGAGLVSMVARLTIGKKGYEDVEGAMKQTLAASEKIRAELTLLVDKDTQEFNQVMAAFKMPKKTQEEKSLRSDSIQGAFQNATVTPLMVAELCLGVLELAMSIAGKANQNAASDLGVAAQMAYAGAQGAVMNVKINLPSIKNLQFSEEKTTKALAFLKSAKSVQGQVLQEINKLIG